MKVDKISVITLTYKNWHMLGKAIKSVANQIIDDKYELEYLIVDDGTDDFDIDYVDELLVGTGLEYRIIVNLKNVGTVSSFNNAIRQSSGDIIVPLSADDEFYDSYVVNDVANEFVKTNAYVITGLRIPVLDGVEGNALPSQRDFIFFNSPRALLKRILVRGNIISGSSTYYHRDVFKNIGFFDTAYRLLEDYPYFIHILSSGFRIHFLNRKLIKYGLSGVSTGGGSPEYRRDLSRLYENLQKNSEVSFIERRYILYHRVMNSKQRLLKSILYPEQVFVFVLRFFR